MSWITLVTVVVFGCSIWSWYICFSWNKYLILSNVQLWKCHQKILLSQWRIQHNTLGINFPKIKRSFQLTVLVGWDEIKSTLIFCKLVRVWIYKSASENCKNYRKKIGKSKNHSYLSRLLCWCSAQKSHILFIFLVLYLFFSSWLIGCSTSRDYQQYQITIIATFSLFLTNTRYFRFF